VSEQWLWNDKAGQCEVAYRGWFCAVSRNQKIWQYRAVMRTQAESRLITGGAMTLAEAQKAVIAAIDRSEDT
jgi:hypothetical protein